MEAKAAEKQRKLGRGLSSLIRVDQSLPVATDIREKERTASRAEDGAPVTAASPVTGPSNGDAGASHLGSGGVDSGRMAASGEPVSAAVLEVALDDIAVSPYQPRKTMDEGALAKLAESVRASGVLQPIVVRAVGGSRLAGAQGVRYELIAGERRWRAARAAGLARVPAIVRVMSDEEAASAALIENVQREDLNAMDRAYALKMLSERFGLQQEELAKRVSLDRSTVANLMRLTELEGEVAELIASGVLSAGHGKALLSIAPSRRVEIARLAAQMHWSVRRIEQVSTHREVAPVSTVDVSPRLAVLRDLERQIGTHLGTKVRIATDRKGSRGRLTLEFYGLDHFDGLLARLGIPTR